MRRRNSLKWTGAIIIAWAGVALCFSLPARCEDAGATPPPVLTLQQAIDAATANNRILRNYNLDWTNAQAEVSRARIKGLPSTKISAVGAQLLKPVEFRFPEGAFGTFPGIGPVPATNTIITNPPVFSVVADAAILQPLTQLRRVRLGVRMQTAAAQVSLEDWRSQRNSLVSEVKQLYYALAQLQSAIDSANQSIKFLTELERFVSDNVKQGTALESDLLEVQARLAKQRYQLSTLDSSYETTKEKLNIAMGREVCTDFTITSVPETAAPTQCIADLQAQALNCRPEVRQARLKTQIASDDEKSKRTESIPDVSLGITYTRQYNIAVIPHDILVAGIIVDWQDPWDWGKRRLEVSEKARIYQKAVNGLQETQSQILVDVNAKYRALEDALSLVCADRLAVKAQEEKRRITMNRYKENTSLLKDVLQADAELAEANRQHLQDQMNAATARAELDQAIGED